jgi:GT2 family glycosyltransferase/glycosyltransferase involved in cell wall biosynthesis
MPGNAPLAMVLSLIAPTRVLLIGPAGSALAVGARWAAREPGITLLRQGDDRGHRTGDLLICERAARLPAFPAQAVTALVPVEEQTAAAERGWSAVAVGPEGFAVLSASTLASEPHEPGLDAYARARLGVSRELQALASQSADDRPPAPPPVAASAPTGDRRGPRRRASDEVSIIVPVHNAAAELRRCLTSLARFTTWPAELVLIDDASTDPEVAEILAEAAEFSGVRVLRNTENLGFTATVNRALHATDRDVVLLNSDTEVGPRWLEHLVLAADEQPGVATVTPISDNAGAFSVPDAGRPNAMPLALDSAGVARLLAQCGPVRARTPTGSGFCLFIRRAALEAVGDFDAEGFPRGYGEENDFCMRAGRAGWSHLVDGSTFVRHVRGASFGAQRPQLDGPARARLDARYPEYTGLVRAFAGGEPTTRLRAHVQEAYRSPAAPRPRILFAIHEGSGGTWVANLELMRALEGEWEPLMLSSDRRTLRLWRVQDGEPVPVRDWTLERRIRATDFWRDDYRAVVRSILVDYAVELVHVRHLFKHTFDLPAVAERLGVPVVLSFHDFYFVCPTVNLLDDHDRYCGGECTPGDGSCRIPAGLDGLPHLKHSYVHQWRAEAESMLRHVDAFVTTSEHARDVHRRWLPSLAGRPFSLIEHGRSLRQRGGIAAAPEPGGQVRILVVANLDVHKGGDYIRALRDSGDGWRLEFHLLGAVPDVYADLGVLHGGFEAGELPERVARIGPSFAGCFSIAAETYSHSLTEAWSMGMPVLATDLGALGERIRAHGGGELLPVDDPAQASRRICAIADDRDAYSRLREQASLSGCASVPAMADAYAALYRSVIDDRRAFVAPATGGMQARAPLGRGVHRMLAVLAGADGRHPGSAFVRVIQRYRHPSVDWKLSLRLRAPEDDPVRPDTDLVLLQRTALDPELTEHFVAALRLREIPLVLDLDDHLLLKEADDADYGAHRDALARVLEAARLVLVSTEPLAQALRQWTSDVAVVPNLIDERLFLAGAERRPGADAGVDRPLQIVYVGSSTHAGDLALLRPVLAALDREHPGRFELNVVGVEPAGADQGWYRRVPVPDDCKPYPRFVAWLRARRPSWDVAVAPLRDDEFNRFKSDLKYLEYGALGLPAMYSDREPYSSVRDGVTGLKLGDDVSEWVEALTGLAGSLELRDQLADNAFREVTSRRLMRHGAEELLAIICGVAQRR